MSPTASPTALWVYGAVAGIGVVTFGCLYCACRARKRSLNKIKAAQLAARQKKMHARRRSSTACAVAVSAKVAAERAGDTEAAAAATEAVAAAAAAADALHDEGGEEDDEARVLRVNAAAFDDTGAEQGVARVDLGDFAGLSPSGVTT